MAERVTAAVALRETERREIEQQIRKFLEGGGKIEQIPLHPNTAKPVGRIWHASYSGSLDG